MIGHANESVLQFLILALPTRLISTHWKRHSSTPIALQEHAETLRRCEEHRSLEKRPASPQSAPDWTSYRPSSPIRLFFRKRLPSNRWQNHEYHVLQSVCQQNSSALSPTGVLQVLLYLKWYLKSSHQRICNSSAIPLRTLTNPCWEFTADFLVAKCDHIPATSASPSELTGLVQQPDGHSHIRGKAKISALLPAPIILRFTPFSLSCDQSARSLSRVTTKSPL